MLSKLLDRGGFRSIGATQSDCGLQTLYYYIDLKSNTFNLDIIIMNLASRLRFNCVNTNNMPLFSKFGRQSININSKNSVNIHLFLEGYIFVSFK
jgi:hypothetical protein